MRPETQDLIGKIGIGIGLAGFTLGMLAAVAANPYIGIPVTVLGFSFFGYFIFSPIIRRRKEKRLMETGIQARGRIVELWDTGVTLNNSPKIAMMIEVTAPTGEVFKAKVSKYISRLDTYAYREGMECIVRYDPEKHSSIMIESMNG